MAEDVERLSLFKKMTTGMVAKNLEHYGSYIYGNYKYRDYSLSEVNDIINNGSIEAQQKLSWNYFWKDGFYKRILTYYATLLLYNGVLIPIPGAGHKLSSAVSKKRYNQALNYVENLFLEEKFQRFALRALINGAYYGVIQQLGEGEFTILDLPCRYCRSRFKDMRGNDIIEFNITYFSGITPESTRAEVLATYPKLFAKFYERYIHGNEPSPWLRIPTDVGVCFPFSEDGRPFFLNIIPATIEYDQAVETERERDAEEIRKIIVQKVPHLNDGQLLFEPDEALAMHEGAVGMLSGNKNVSVMTTYNDVEAIVSKTSAESIANNLEKMVQNIYANTGASAQIFAPTGSQSLTTSIQNDTALMMCLANQFSRFMTGVLNSVFGNVNISFKYLILPITYYNRSDWIIDSFKLAQSGYSFILPTLALGISQRDFACLKELENTVLNVEDMIKPLPEQGSEQLTAGPGAPAKKPEEKSPRSIANEDSKDNQ